MGIKKINDINQYLQYDKYVYELQRWQHLHPLSISVTISNVRILFLKHLKVVTSLKSGDNFKRESTCRESSTRRSPNRPLVFGQNVLHAPGSCYNTCICKPMFFLKVLLIRLQMVVVYESLICKTLTRKMLVFWISRCLREVVAHRGTTFF